MSLPQVDLTCLDERGTEYSIIPEGNMTCVLLKAYALPIGYDQPQSDLLLRLSPGYPDVPPDMWWFDPPVKRADGVTVQATDSVEHYLGRAWQRWSRHLGPGQWRSGIDCIESYLALVRKELERAALAPVT